MEFVIRLDLSLFPAVFLALILFGIGYNALVSWMERRGYTEGYLSLIVAFGVAATLAFLAILSWQVALLALGGFIASGTPMIIGSIARYISKRAEAQVTIKREILDDDQTAPLAE